MIIRVILIAAVCCFGAMLFVSPSLGRRLFRRLIGLSLIPLGVFCVLAPNAVTWVANRVGVVRGTDLVFYVATFAFAFLIIALTQRIATLEHRIAALTRETALRTAPSKDRSGLR